MIIYESDVQEYIFQELVKRGYTPTEKEADEIGSICFDYFVKIGMIDDEIIDDDW